MVTHRPLGKLVLGLDGEPLEVGFTRELEGIPDGHAADDGQNRVQAPELDGVEDHLPEPGVQGKLQELQPEVGEVFIFINRAQILQKQKTKTKNVREF